jgi:hypothetical protein
MRATLGEESCEPEVESDRRTRRELLARDDAGQTSTRSRGRGGPLPAALAWPQSLRVTSWAARSLGRQQRRPPEAGQEHHTASSGAAPSGVRQHLAPASLSILSPSG